VTGRARVVERRRDLGSFSKREQRVRDARRAAHVSVADDQADAIQTFRRCSFMPGIVSENCLATWDLVPGHDGADSAVTVLRHG